MTVTLADLLTQKTVPEIFSQLIGYYQAAGFPTTSWQPFGVERTRLMAISTAINDISANYIPSLAAGGFVDTATTGWLQLLAQELYDIQFNAASRTVGTITLHATALAGPYTYTAGQLIAVFGSGNRYVNTTGGVLASGGTLSLTWAAEFAGAKYADPSSATNITLVTSFPGVTLTNVAGNFTTVSHVGAGVGTITPSATPDGSHQVVIRIDSTGNIADSNVSWSYSLDGAPYVSVGILAVKTNLGGTGITVTLADTSGTITNFAENDEYLFSSPGTWITTQGADVESDSLLASRCRDRWYTLSPIPTNSFYDLIAKSTPTVGSQVTQVIVLNDSVVNNKVNIVVAGPAGALPGATITAIQNYVNKRVPLTDLPVVISPTPLDITLSATITVSAAQYAAAKIAIELTAMPDYIHSVGINGTIRLAKLTELIMETAGVADVATVKINGVAANKVLGNSVTFIIANLVAINFTYVTT